MNNSYYETLDENFAQALKLYEQSYSHEELIELLKTGNIVQKQIAALRLEKITSDKDATVLVDNLTGQDGKIREAVSLRLNEFMSNPKFLPYFCNIGNFDVFLDAIIDINANICRLVVDSAKLLKKESDFTHIYEQRILEFTQDAFDELDKFIFRDKKYVINKQLFKLYWCLETLQNYYMEIDNIKLKQILEQGAAQSEYTIREKVAQIVRLAGGFEDLKNKLEQDENYYVRAIFNS